MHWICPPLPYAGSRVPVRVRVMVSVTWHDSLGGGGLPTPRMDPCARVKLPGSPLTGTFPVVVMQLPESEYVTASPAPLAP